MNELRSLLYSLLYIESIFLQSASADRYDWCLSALPLQPGCPVKCRMDCCQEVTVAVKVEVGMDLREDDLGEQICLSAVH